MNPRLSVKRVGRLTRAAMTIALGVAGLLGAKAAAPGNVFACYCTVPETVRAYATDADIVIVAGTLVASDTFRVERVYRGSIAVGGNPIVVDTSSCGFPMQEAERWVMAARVVRGALRPDLCTSHARVGSTGADALLADIESVYGAQAPLGTDPAGPSAAVQPAPVDPTPLATSAPPPSPTSPDRELVLPIILGALFVLVLLLFGVVAFVARRTKAAR